MRGGALFAVNLLALVSAAGMARGQSVEYEFDTGSGQVTRNGQQVFDFEGVPFVGLGASGGGVYTWAVLGDMTVSGVVEVKFTGPNLASVLVGRDFRVFAGGVIRADADGADGGPGGGSGGAGGSGGDGGTGGTGGGGANGEDGLRGRDAAGQSAGAGGLLYQEGGAGGNGTTTGGGQAGGSGLARIAGENGEIGVGGSSGSPGSPGVNNPVFPSQGGTPGGPGLGGLGGVQPGGGGFGGQAGAPGLGGGDGTDGSPGFEAGDGGDGSSPAPYLPAPDAVLVLNGGSGGSGGGAGGGGGGGGAGSSGAGGGGGGGGRGGITVVGDDIIISGGGGGGGGGGAGSGGRGGEGGTGGEGASGGGGGGGVRFLVQGRVDIDGLISARGADFSGQNDGAPGSDGEDGGQGGPGGQGAPGFGPLGQHGGPGGPGGAGGRGGPGGTGGDGGRGGGGGGGAVFLAGTALGGLGSVDLGGGLGAISIAPSGRVVVSEATVDSFDFVYPVTPAATTRTTLLSPVAESPYFSGLVTPNIVPSGAGLANLDGGPGPFGVLPLGFNDPQILGAAGSAPAGAVAAVIRYDAGPSPYDLAYSLDSATATADAFDVFVLVNLSAGPIRPDINGEPVARLPYTQRIEFGGGGLPEAVDIGFGRSWAMLGPETGDVSLVVRLGQAETTLILADPASGDAETVYFVPACVADLAEPFGVLNFFDLTAFVGLYNAGDPAADLAAPFGVFNFFDVSAYLDLYNAGCP